MPPEVVLKAPVFEMVLSSRVNPPNESVAIAFLATDRRKFELEFSITCTPLTIAALAAELGRLASTLPADKQPRYQPIVVKRCQPAMRDNGSLALILHLETG